MNKKEAIKQIDLTIQLVTESIKLPRQHINLNVLPEVEESVVVTELIKRARRLLVLANREVNAKLEEAKARISKPTVKPRLDPDLDYRKTGIIYSSWFFMGGLTLRTDYPNHPILGNYLDEYFEPVIDYIAEHDISNVVRVEGVASFGSPPRYPDPYRYHLVPHPMKSNGLFDLHEINKEWKDQQIRRLEYIAERGITTRYIFNCQSSINGWFIHWLNGNLNDGWNGAKTYEDRYGWCHCWHYAGKDPTAIKEYNEGRMSEERAWELIHEYEATKDYLIMLREYVANEILKPFKSHIMEDNNEIEAGSNWHGQEADFQAGKGTTIPWNEVNLLNDLRFQLIDSFGESAMDLKCEGNKYYAVSKTGIGYHGDSERRKVIGVRLGHAMSMHWMWFYNNEPRGLNVSITLQPGDIYAMSEKTVGTDWRPKRDMGWKSKRYTLRHAAGADKYTIKTPKIQIRDQYRVDENITLGEIYYKPKKSKKNPNPVFTKMP